MVGIYHDTLCEIMKTLDSFTTILQRNETTESELMASFDIVIDQFPSTKSILRSDAEIVKCRLFEWSIVKIHRKRRTDLTVERYSSVEGLGLKSFHVTYQNGDLISLADMAMQRHKEELVKSGIFVDFPSFHPSNICEHLFSKSRYALTD